MHFGLLFRRVRARIRKRFAGSRDRDSADQLRTVMAAEFTRRRLMSRAEFSVFRIVEEVVQSSSSGCRVFSQTALGQILHSPDRLAYWAINSKRVDVLVVSSYGEPLFVVEYQGGGHHQGDAAARDAVKKEALRRAGVEYLEVAPHHAPEQIGLLVRITLQRMLEARRPTDKSPWAA